MLEQIADDDSVWNRMPTLSQVLLKRATMIGMIEYCAESLPETSVI